MFELVNSRRVFAAAAALAIIPAPRSRRLPPLQTCRASASRRPTSAAPPRRATACSRIRFTSRICAERPSCSRSSRARARRGAPCRWSRIATATPRSFPAARGSSSSRSASTPTRCSSRGRATRTSRWCSSATPRRDRKAVWRDRREEPLRHARGVRDLAGRQDFLSRDAVQGAHRGRVRGARARGRQHLPRRGRGKPLRGRAARLHSRTTSKRVAGTDTLDRVAAHGLLQAAERDLQQVVLDLHDGPVQDISARCRRCICYACARSCRPATH